MIAMVRHGAKVICGGHRECDEALGILPVSTVVPRGARRFTLYPSLVQVASHPKRLKRQGTASVLRRRVHRPLAALGRIVRHLGWG